MFVEKNSINQSTFDQAVSRRMNIWSPVSV